MGTSSTASEQGTSAPLEAEPARRRSGPLRFVGEIVSELRSSVWPSRRTMLASVALTTSALAAVAILVAVLDLVSQEAVRRLVDASLSAPLGRPVLLGVQVVSMLVAAFVLLRQPPPSGGGSLFGGSSALEESSLTTSKRTRWTALAVAAFILSSTLLSVLY